MEEKKPSGNIYGQVKTEQILKMKTETAAFQSGKTGIFNVLSIRQIYSTHCELMLALGNTRKYLWKDAVITVVRGHQEVGPGGD